MKQRNIFPKVIKLFLAIILVIFIYFSIYTFIQKKQNLKKPEFITTTITKGNLMKQIVAVGNLKPVSEIEVGSQISGKIKKVFVKHNSIVKKGEVLAELDKSILSAKLRAAKAAISKSKAQLELAKINYKKSKEMYEQKHISHSEYIIAVTNYNVAKADLEHVNSQYDIAKADLECATIISPVNGVVISKNADVGKSVSSNLEVATLFTIAENLKSLEIEATISEADISWIKTGQPVEFTVDSYDGKIFHGTVEQVRLSPTVVDNVVTYTVIIKVDNNDLKLLPGMTVQANIDVAKKNNIFIIPNIVFTFSPKKVVGKSRNISSDQILIYTLKDGKIFPIVVKKGLSDGVSTQIIGKNLKVGEKIVQGVLNGNDKSAQKTKNKRIGMRS